MAGYSSFAAPAGVQRQLAMKAGHYTLRWRYRALLKLDGVPTGVKRTPLYSLPRTLVGVWRFRNAAGYSGIIEEHAIRVNCAMTARS